MGTITALIERMSEYDPQREPHPIARETRRMIYAVVIFAFVMTLIVAPNLDFFAAVLHRLSLSFVLFAIEFTVILYIIRRWRR